MNQAHTTYQSDYTPFDWFQNNVISEINEFCSPENIDECLKYISQEFCALGYPSIYSEPTDCPFAVNCDIVKFINATFELLRRNSDHIQVKQDFESRNQRLSSDLNVYNKKNSQLKSALEQTERKLASALEKDRQLKEKNEQLSQLLKAEKEETKKLTAQLRQQKIVYQHEIRKYENNMNHIKAKLNQILSDKNPNKKIASISMSHALPRNNGQRGKWKTSTTSTTAVEDMYNSVISSYEARCKDMYKELNAFRQCLQSILLQTLESICILQENYDGNNCHLESKEFVLNDIEIASRNIHTFEDKFKYLLSILKKIVSEKSHNSFKNLEDELNILKSKVCEYEEIIEKSKEPTQAEESQVYVNNDSSAIPNKEVSKSLTEEFIKREKVKLEEEKLALSKSLENIEKQKLEISEQKVAFLRLTMQQKVSPSAWHQTLNTFPSISVITCQNGERKISTSSQLKSSLSLPEQILEANNVPCPEWDSSKRTVDNFFYSKSDSVLLSESKSASELPAFPPVTANVKFSNSDLPSWAANGSEIQSLNTDDMQNALEVSHNISTDEIEVPNESSSEELSLLRLKAAVQDIEKKRFNIS